MGGGLVCSPTPPLLSPFAGIPTFPAAPLPPTHPPPPGAPHAPSQALHPDKARPGGGGGAVWTLGGGRETCARWFRTRMSEGIQEKPGGLVPSQEPRPREVLGEADAPPTGVRKEGGAGQGTRSQPCKAQTRRRKDGWRPAHLHALDFQLHVVLAGGLPVLALLPEVTIFPVLHLLAVVEDDGAVLRPGEGRLGPVFGEQDPGPPAAPHLAKLTLSLGHRTATRHASRR